MLIMNLSPWKLPPHLLQETVSSMTVSSSLTESSHYWYIWWRKLKADEGKGEIRVWPQICLSRFCFGYLIWFWWDCLGSLWWVNHCESSSLHTSRLPSDGKIIGREPKHSETIKELMKICLCTAMYTKLLALAELPQSRASGSKVKCRPCRGRSY